MELKGKTALIAGAGRNIGKAVALTFAREGADVILVARSLGDTLNEVARECESFGVMALPLLADLGRHEEVNRVVQLGLERFGKVDTLVSVAAQRCRKPFWEFSYDEWQQVFAVNVHSTFYLAKALAPGMIKRKCGVIVAMGAVASLTTMPNFALETASKHSLYGLIKSIALELAPHGIRANMIALSKIESVKLDAEYQGMPEVPLGPMGRKGTTREVADTALFLASDKSSFITGDRILCAGGIYM